VNLYFGYMNTAKTNNKSWQVDILTQCQSAEIEIEYLKSALLKVLSELDLRHSEVSADELSVVFCDDDYIHALNKTFRNKDRATDVLSFPQYDPDSAVCSTTLGDVVVSIETAERQAKELGVEFQTEIIRLLVHGVLHLYGYEHEDVSPETVRKMQDLEDLLIQSIG